MAYNKWNQKKLTETSKPIVLDTSDYSILNSNELRKKLDERGISYSADKTKFQLEELLRKDDMKIVSRKSKADKESDKMMKKIR